VLRLVVPFLYFLDTRVRSRAERMAWSFTYLVPVHLMAVFAGADAPWTALVAAAVAVVAVYATYEYGYMVNDSVTILAEVQPTLRLPAERLAQVREALPRVLAARLVILVAAAGAVGMIVRGIGGDGSAASLATTVLGGGILLWYELYNRVRGRISIVLFHGLVAARCVGPLAVAFAALGLPLGDLWLLAVVYALPNTIEFAAKPKYRLLMLAPVAAQVDRWRVVYYAFATLIVVTAHAAGALTLDPAVVRALLGGLLYFLAWRSFIVLGPARRWRRT
jgi:hypothetical protein